MAVVHEATVVSIKKSQFRKGLYFVTVNDGLGEIRVAASRSYKVGDKVHIKRRNPVDFVWDIVKEGK